MSVKCEIKQSFVSVLYIILYKFFFFWICWPEFNHFLDTMRQSVATQDCWIFLIEQFIYKLFIYLFGIFRFLAGYSGYRTIIIILSSIRLS